MRDIKKEVAEMLEDPRIEEILFEVSNIVVYTRNKSLFTNGEDKIREVVNKLKKRVEVRMVPDMLLDEEETKKKVTKILEEHNAQAEEFWFDHDRSVLYLEMLKPEDLTKDIVKKIKEETNWSVQANRYPIVKSDLVRAIREMLYSNFAFRKKFMNEIGEKIYYSNINIDPQNYWIRVTGLGGFRQVGRSAVFLQTPYSRVLMDVGLDVSNPNAPYPILDAPEFRLNELNAVIISHSHLDHCGFLPALFRYGYRGPVYTTAPTRDIMTLLHLDYYNLSQKSMDVQKIFDIDDIKEMLKYTIVLNYQEVTDITPDVRITLFDAGHILGSAMVHANIGNGLYNLLYTGDFKFAKSKTLSKPRNIFERVEAVIMESTYGGDFDTQPSREESEKMLYSIIEDTIRRGGKVLIPVLAVGRSQEIMLLLEEWRRKGLLPADIKVYLDGMLRNVAAIYTVYPEFLNKEIRSEILEYDDNPFLSAMFKHVGSREERDQILAGPPSIILATSGMLEGGPSVYYFANMCENQDNAIVLVSYQGENTLGRKLYYGAKEVEVEVNGVTKKLTVNARVYLIDGFSGHSDRYQLSKFITTMKPTPRKVLVIHGEESKSNEFAHFLRSQGINAIVPNILDAIRLR
jgi:KH/beta-lactamase-domain protein